MPRYATCVWRWRAALDSTFHKHPLKLGLKNISGYTKVRMVSPTQLSGHMSKLNTEEKIEEYPVKKIAKVPIKDNSSFNNITRTKQNSEKLRDSYKILSQPLADNSNAAESVIDESVLDKISPCAIEQKDGNRSDKAQVTENEQWKEKKLNLSKLPKYYLQLSKSRLSTLVVVTASSGYCMAPAEFQFTTFALMSLGTFMLSCSANATNQFLEVPYDSQMSRTKNRVLVKKDLSPLHAMMFAGTAAMGGVGLLWYFTNPLTTALGVANLLLYTAVYTPMKRVSVANTWVGGVVGAIPPLMGWAACTGHLELGAWLMAGILYAWQFPHFNSLSWYLRGDYARGGYRMVSMTNPALCRRVALRYAVAMLPLCLAAPCISLTTWTFAATSTPPNLWLTWCGWKFYKNADTQSARQLFRASLLHLPLIMVLLAFTKKKTHEKKTTS